MHKYTTFENMVLSHWLTRDIASLLDNGSTNTISLQLFLFLENLEFWSFVSAQRPSDIKLENKDNHFFKYHMYYYHSIFTSILTNEMTAARSNIFTNKSSNCSTINLHNGLPANQQHAFNIKLILSCTHRVSQDQKIQCSK